MSPDTRQQSQNTRTRLPWMTLVVTVLIIVGLLMPSSSLPSVGADWLNVVAHIVMFGIWAIVANIEFPQRLWTIGVIGVGFALLTELLQLAAEGRAFQWADILADALGLLAGSVTIHWWQNRLQ